MAMPRSATSTASGNGSITIDASNTVTLTGGSGEGQHYAQIGNGSDGVNGNESGDIAINAGGDIVLTGGDGNEAYAQIGHGGAESNEGQQRLCALRQHHAGRGQHHPCGRGNGRCKLRPDRAWRLHVRVRISVAQAHRSAATFPSQPVARSSSPAMAMTAYAQIGNGGDEVNLHAGAGSSASINGNITVVASDEGGVMLAAGNGANAYAQIGNGGYDINGSNGSSIDGFTIGGNIAVSDLALIGGDTGRIPSRRSVMATPRTQARRT